MKYGIWKVSQLEAGAVNALVGSGYAPLAAMVLASRGIGDDRQARAYLDCNAPLLDPFLMTDMDKAAGRVGLAMSRGEKIAVFGDYDVDGITATCLLTDFLRRHGADVVSYIPGRLEEGYGLNPIAIHQLHAEGVKLIVTVDCGITAVNEAELCKQLGIDLVITDHHECKQTLPAAVAVVDPHRCDGGYPHKNLSGVGVAFKLASALCGSQETVLEEYADMVCLGTVADVMPLQGENRVFVARGLESLAHTKRPGIAALMAECGCAPETVSASSIGFMLAPRINAAGRMGQIDLAVELFLTDDPDKAAEKLGKKYEDVNLIVCHLGGGVSVGAHQHGRVVDVCNVKDEGAMGMDRAGGLPVNQLINYCFSGKTKDEVKRTFGRRAGMFSYLGTTDFRVVCAKVVEGDPKAVEAYQALVYQLAKDIGAMAAVLHFDVDAIVYTAGMAYEDFFCDDITAYVGKIAPIIRLPGEEEMRSLAEGALRVLRGQQEAGQY